ncbi:DUF3369 domain-containing protein [Salinimonas lutimaris]|uniref:DUF3369 domain-containing protein n=1 Tax=Salinimonas lutimaris TaxID=914153 RepID=UPI0010C04CC4|nr:DUF3369 domain-containing protein [Salinimonas lutimaris]
MAANPLFAKKKPVVESGDNNEKEAEVGFKVLIVDDETEVHRVTDLTLKRFKFDGKKIEFLHAYSAQEAMEVFKREKDISLALVDVVMETDHAGLDLVHWVRKDHKDHLCRLILRTGQPGQAPEHEVIEKYDINDYKEKTELTSQKLKTLMYSGLRSYRDISTIELHRKGLRQVIESTGNMLKSNSMTAFATAVLKEIMNILQLESTAVYCSTFSRKSEQGSTSRVLAATGELVKNMESADIDQLPESVKKQFDRALAEQCSFYSPEGYVFYTQTDGGHENLLYIDIKNDLTPSQRELLEIYCINVALAYENLLMSEEVLDTQRELVYLLGDAVEMRSKETGAHVKRVSLISYMLAQKYGLSEQECLMIKKGSPLHDLGKVAIPDSILHKPAKLDKDEWDKMKTHAMVGYDILKKSQKPILVAAAEISLTHHEKWDGSGYPRGLKGDDIPISGRITAVADVFDALGSKRAYKDPWDSSKIKAILEEERGRHFDPALIDIMIESFDEFLSIREQFPDGDA